MGEGYGGSKEWGDGEDRGIGMGSGEVRGSESGLGGGANLTEEMQSDILQ